MQIEMNTAVEIAGAVFRTILDFGTVAALVTLGYQMKKDFHQDFWDQATKVSSWIEDEMQITGEGLFAIVCICNASESPIYDVIISRDRVDGNDTESLKGDDECDYALCIPPGTHYAKIRSNGNGMHARFNSSISFRDTRGNYWHRDACGHLSVINESTIRFRGLTLPVIESLELERKGK